MWIKYVSNLNGIPNDYIIKYDNKNKGNTLDENLITIDVLSLSAVSLKMVVTETISCRLKQLYNNK